MVWLDEEVAPLPAGALHRHVLSLSGGGFRGLFTARALELFEEEAGRPCRDAFDLIAGTSIGGILAIGLAAGVPARRLRRAIGTFGPHIFRGGGLSLGGFIAARYRQEPLRRAVAAMLGARACTPLSEIGTPLLVTAVDQSSGTAQLLLSGGLAGAEASPLRLIDAALATSAAPTYFPVHRHDGRAYVDGGLIANAPDLLALTELMRRTGVGLDDLSLLSVGTAGQPAAGGVRSIRAPGSALWLTRHRLVDLIIGAQEGLAFSQAQVLLGDRAVRVDDVPPAKIPLDAADGPTADLLLARATDAVAKRRTEQRLQWNRFLNHRSVGG